MWSIRTAKCDPHLESREGPTGAVPRRNSKTWGGARPGRSRPCTCPEQTQKQTEEADPWPWRVVGEGVGVTAKSPGLLYRTKNTWKWTEPNQVCGSKG